MSDCRLSIRAKKRLARSEARVADISEQAFKKVQRVAPPEVPLTGRLLVLVAYDGTDFEGFQTQPHGRPTIQDALEKRLSSLFYPPLRGSQPSARRVRSKARRDGKEGDEVAGKLQPPSLHGTVGDDKNVGASDQASISCSADIDQQHELEQHSNDTSTPRAAVTLIGAGRTDAGVHARAQKEVYERILLCANAAQKAFHFDLPPTEANRVLKSIARGKRTIFCDARALTSSTADQADKHRAEDAAREAANEADDESVKTAVTLTLAEAARAVALALSNGLPRGLCVKSVAPAPGADPLQRGFDFHARESCKGKRYVYTVAEGSGGGDPFLARQAWVLGYGGSGDSSGQGKRLNVAAMQEAAALLEGAHDFSTFAVMQPGDRRSPVRNLRRLEVQAWPRPLPLGATSKGKHPDENEGHGGDGDDDGGELGPERVITITAECHQFLYHMVRFLAGTLVEVGRGRSPPSGVVEALAAKVRLPGGSVVLAPARGLCLDRCFYDGPAWDESPSSATEAAHAE